MSNEMPANRRYRDGSGPELLRPVLPKIGNTQLGQQCGNFDRDAFGHGDKRYLVARPTGAPARRLNPLLHGVQVRGKQGFQGSRWHESWSRTEFGCPKRPSLTKIRALPRRYSRRLIMQLRNLMADISAFRALRYDLGRVGALS